MKKVILPLLAALIAVPRARALELPDILGDNSMLQQRSEAKLWGWAKAGNYVQVTTGWDHRQYIAQADGDGRWALRVATPQGGYTPYDIIYNEYADQIGRAHV